jgi:hypothetical protein
MDRFMARTITPAPDSIVCVDEDTLLRITGVARSTRRNWVKESLIDDRPDGRYYEQDVLVTALVALIVKATKGLADARRVWHSTRDSLLSAVASVPEEKDLALVLELRLLRGTLTSSAAQVGPATRPFEPFVLIPVGPHAVEAREGFRKFAVPPRAKADGRRREGRLHAKRPSDHPSRSG